MKIYTSLTPKECLKRIKNPQPYLGEINRKKYSSYFVDKEGKTKKGKRLQIEVNDNSFEIFVKTWGVYRRHFYMEIPRIRQLGLLKGRIYESETEGTIIRYHMNACDPIMGLIALILLIVGVYILSTLLSPSQWDTKYIVPYTVMAILVGIQVTYQVVDVIYALQLYRITLRFIKDLLDVKHTREDNLQQVSEQNANRLKRKSRQEPQNQE